jgi:hypothetical protein
MSFLKKLGSGFLGLSSASQEMLSVNFLTLSFTEDLSQYEKAFREDYFIRSLNPFRFSLILSMIFYGAFAILDAATVPTLKELFWFIRFGIVFPVLIMVYLFTYSKIFQKYMQLVITCIMFITGLGIIIMIIYAAQVENYSYYAGLILIFIFGYTFIRARFIYASIAGWSIVILYEISAVWISQTPGIILVNNNYFFISANIIGMFISYFLELSARKEFYMRILLEHEKENVKTANDELEKRVEERTIQLSGANFRKWKQSELWPEELLMTLTIYLHLSWVILIWHGRNFLRKVTSGSIWSRLIMLH